MFISKVTIENFKCFKGTFEVELEDGVNIIVGDNASGKTTILEAIHLALTGTINGRPIGYEMSQYLFNKEIEKNYIESFKTNRKLPPPEIKIQLNFKDENNTVIAELEGDGGISGKDECCILFKIAFDDSHNESYQEFIENGEINSIPIEYYKPSWISCARKNLLPRNIPFKSAYVDASSSRYKNSSDIYISQIIDNNLTETEKLHISQAYRFLKERFMKDPSIEKLSGDFSISSGFLDGQIQISADLATSEDWRNRLITYVEEIPFHHIGKGEQSKIKTKIAISSKKNKKSDVILLEEPENHLSHTNLSNLLDSIKGCSNGRQLIVTTHSSYVANKLDLKNLILLSNYSAKRLGDLKLETQNYFKRLSGFETLRLILSKKAILVEGPSDELILQRAFNDKYGVLPIARNIEVISVGTSSLRFLEIAGLLNLRVANVVDNDGDLDKLNKKYEKYYSSDKSNIQICFEDKVYKEQELGIKNLNTLEPCILRANQNNLNIFNNILNAEFRSVNELLKHMLDNKTEVALRIFESKNKINFPKYILEAIEHVV